jgi:hypothetical protein
MGQKTSFILACLRYALRDSAKLANALAALAGAFVLWAVTAVTGFPIRLPEGIPGLFLGAVYSFIAVWVVVFAWRFFAAAFHYMLHPHVRPLTRIRGMLGEQMWPIILMIAGICSFVVLFGGGAVWYLMATAAKDNVTLSQGQLTDLINKSTAGSAAARLVYLQNNSSEFEKAADQYEAASKQIMEALLKESTNPRMMVRLREPTAIMTKLIKSDFNTNLSLNRHPRYDENQNIQAPDDQLIKSDSLMTEYRKFFDTYVTSMAEISSWKQQYIMSLRQAKATFDAYARPTFTPP